MSIADQINAAFIAIHVSLGIWGYGVVRHGAPLGWFIVVLNAVAGGAHVIALAMRWAA